MQKATARAHPNIAFIKYWGNINHDLRIPVNSSLSMNLDGLYTETEVEWDSSLSDDTLRLNDKDEQGTALSRVSAHLDVLRERLNIDSKATIVSANNFPMGAGIASSAAAFAALTLAGVAAAGQTLSERELSTLARRGSGSASRSIPAGFVEWYQGDSHESSFAESIAAPDYWQLVDVIAVISQVHKETGSTQGHRTADTSDLQNARVRGAAQRLEICKKALLDRNFTVFADVIEEDSNLMHAVMMTSRPALFYWQPATLALMQAVREWRAEGLNVCYTLDAGPNVHCICTADNADAVAERLAQIDGVEQVLKASAGGAAYLTNV
ncbi:MAG: diphosphomevalonate decarboxylase [Aggregatilineales bacterium]